METEALNMKLDELESGDCREIMPDEVYMPCHKSRGWIRCTFNSPDENVFHVFLEGSERFLLRAKYIDKTFYISTDENFNISHPSEGGYIAKLIQTDSSFVLVSTTCRYCDYQLGKYECCPNSSQREVLAKISHVNRRHRIANVDMRCTIITLPNIQNGNRLIWCSRAFKSHGINSPDITSHINKAPYQSLGMILLNRLPEWDEILECLVLKFQGNRVRFPSARNILLYEEHEINRKKKYKKELTADDAIFQFGKSLPEEYILDFRFPLSPLQSFAVALSTYSYASNARGGPLSSAPGSGSGAVRSSLSSHQYYQAQNPKP